MLEQFSTFSEDFRKGHVDLTLPGFCVDSKDLEAGFDGESFGASDVGNNVRVGRGLGNLTEHTLSMHENRLWNEHPHIVDDVLVRVIELLLRLLDRDRIAVSILVFEVVRRAIDDEATIDHDGNLVTELLSLVHAMRRQQY